MNGQKRIAKKDLGVKLSIYIYLMKMHYENESRRIPQNSDVVAIKQSIQFRIIYPPKIIFNVLYTPDASCMTFASGLL